MDIRWDLYLICTLTVQLHYKQIRMIRYIDNVEQPWTKMNNDFGDNSTNDAQVTYYVFVIDPMTESVNTAEKNSSRKKGAQSTALTDVQT